MIGEKDAVTIALISTFFIAFATMIEKLYFIVDVNSPAVKQGGLLKWCCSSFAENEQIGERHSWWMPQKLWKRPRYDESQVTNWGIVQV